MTSQQTITANTLDGELLRRRCRRNYSDYVQLANDGFCMTHFHKYLCDQIQEFLSVRTGNAFDILLLAVPPQHGKGARKDMPVFTPDGWRLHGDLKVGDKVYHADGSIATVTYVHPDYCLPEYEIEFKTGEKIQVSPQHLWNIEYTDRSKKSAERVTKLVETQDIFNQSRYLVERSPRVRVNAPLQNADKQLPIDPYLLGLWLGDGYSHAGQICGMIDDLIEYDVCSINDIIVIRDDFGITPHLIDTALLKQLRLYKNKHIPQDYLTASIEQRRALLTGLLDTDGNISKNNNLCEICVANERLAQDIYTLVRSLGYKAQFRERITHNSTEGFEGKAYRVLWRPMNGDVLFRLQRKQSILDSYIDAPLSDISFGYYITSVRKIRDNVVGNCITVDGDGTYLIGKDLIPTHNSFTVTETLPSWYLGQNPRDSVILAGYESTFAEAFSRRNRDKFNNYAQYIFQDATPNMNVQGVALWETLDGGRCRAAGLKAGITGHGADLFIIDDPIKNREAAMSETVIAKIHAEMGPSVQSRIHPGGKLIVIQTRWVENDVIGWVESNWPELIWKNINLPCECEEPTNDPLGRKLGDSLMGDHLDDPPIPQRIRNDNIWLQSKKKVVKAADGESTWNALYQGHPTAQQGNLFNDQWWKYYKRSEMNFTDFDYTLLSIDATFKKAEDNDFNGITLWGMYRNEFYLWKLINKRMDFVETVQTIKNIVKDYPTIDNLIIEAKANGDAIIDTLRYSDGIPPIVAVNPVGGKYSRAQAVSPFVEKGLCHIPTDWTPSELKDVEWYQEEKTPLLPHQKFVHQLAHFPFAKHDDMVDSSTQALTRLIKLMTGEEPRPMKKILRYVKWYPDMWEDYNQMSPLEQDKFIATYGAPEEWKDFDTVE